MRPVIPALALSLAIMLTGCVPAADDTPNARDTLASLANLQGDELLDAVTAIAAIGEAEARKAAGVDEALGGTIAADEIFDRLAQPTAELSARYRTTPPSIELTSYRAEGGGFLSLFGMGFGLLDIMEKHSIDMTNDGELGKATEADPGSTLVMESTPDGHVTTDFTAENTENGATTKMSMHSDLEPCPAADGSLELHSKGTISYSGNGRSATIELDITATGMLDSNAELVTSNYSYRQQMGSGADGKGQFFDASGDDTGAVTVNRESSQLTDQYLQTGVDLAAAIAEYAASSMLETAKAGWESGRCVDLTITPSEDPGSLATDTEVTIVADPRAKYDGKQTGGTVDATHTGEGAIDLEGKVAAPATFTYLSAKEKDKTGTITFESRSNRGVGTASIDLTTGGRAYTAKGTEGEFTATGTICSLLGTFTVTGAGLTITMTPANEFGGTFKLTGTEDGVYFIGDGEYSVKYGKTDVATDVILDGHIDLTTPEGIAVTTPTNLDLKLTPTKACD